MPEGDIDQREQFSPRGYALEELQKLILRSGLTPREALRYYTGDAAPAGLKYHHVEAWLSSGEEIPPDHLRFVLGIWSGISVEDYKVPVTAATRALLMGYKEASQIGAHRLLRGRDDVPEDVSAAAVQSWMNGRVDRVRAGALQYVLRLWSHSASYIPLHEEIRTHLRGERDRTGFAGARLIKGRTDLPNGLTASVINNWISGAARTARSDHVDHALGLWRELPDKPQRP